MSGVGMALSEYQTRPVKGIPDDWRHRFLKRGFRSVTFSLKKYGGTSWRAALWKCQCVRMQHWYCQVREGRQRDDCRYDGLDIAVLALDVVHDVLNLPDGHVIKQRFFQICRMWPKSH